MLRPRDSLIVPLALAAFALLGAGPAAAAPRPRIEVAFVLDATGSMGPWIDEARSRIKSIAADLAAGDPQPDVQFALVSYRDRGDAYVTRVSRFSPDIEAMRAALDGTQAEGGGDTPEAVLEALAVGLDDLKWSEDADTVRLLYLVGDARPQHYADGPDEQVLLTLALDRGIVIHSIACGRMSLEGQTFFERIARFSEGRPFRLADRVPGHVSERGETGAAGATSLRSAVSGTARAYSGAAGVAYAGTPVTALTLPMPPLIESGLIGAHLRVVSDSSTWSDLWRAHAPGAGSTEVPVVDFAIHQVLVLGCGDAGLELVTLTEADGLRVATVRPASAGVRFALVPAAETPVIARDAATPKGGTL